MLIFNYAQTLKGIGLYDEAKNWFLMYAEGHSEIGSHFAESCDFAKYRSSVPSLYTVKPANINTELSDFGPAFYNNKLVFSSSRQDMQRSQNNPGSNWTGNAFNQLFYGELANETVGKPAFFLNDLKNSANIGPVSFSGNGKWVVYTKNNFVDGTRQVPGSGLQMSLYIAEIDINGNWKTAKAFPYNSDAYSNGYPSVSADGTVLYYASDRPDGFGGYDIYVSKKINDAWSTPINLGPIVNTMGNEISPSFDGRDLYFSSDWHPGFGGMDIFRAESESDNWTKVFHLGSEINSSRDDYGFVFDHSKNIGFFTSNRTGGKGYEDIYQIRKITDNIVITVLDEKANQPVSGAVIDFSPCGERTFNTDENGRYSFQALPGMTCNPIVRKDGYKEKSFQIVTNSGGASTQRIEVTLLKIAEEVIAANTNNNTTTTNSNSNNTTTTTSSPSSSVSENLFRGRVVSYDSKAIVDGVMIRATSQNSNEQLETVSNSNGEYSLPLKDGETYIVRYSKVGFRDMNKTISASSQGKDLGTLPMLSSGTIVSNTKDVTAPPPSPTPTPEEETAVSSADFAYGVQVAAFFNKPNVNITGYKKDLESIGSVYTTTKDNVTKVRVGFSSREDAIAAMPKIKGLGYSSAFLAQEDNASQSVASTKENTTTTVNPTPTPEPVTTPVTTPAPPPAPVSYSKYKVRLAAYRSLASFDEAKVANLGRIEKYTWNGFTIVVLSDYVTRADAEAALTKVRALGFKDAVLATKERGRLRSVR